jgi:peptidoglycan/xylan/chitin deacetylase (PgdA/CDA1 family)
MRILFTILILTTYKSTFASCNQFDEYQRLLSLKNQCQVKNVHLSFDDGPDPNVTPKILEALNRNGVQGSFYVSTTNLKKNQAHPLLIKMINDGHIVASHGHHHHAHDLRLIKIKGQYQCDPNQLSEEQSQKEIQLSLDLLDDATLGQFSKQKYKLFRFPYGRGASPSKDELTLITRYGTSKKLSQDQIHTEQITGEEYRQMLREYRRFRSEPLKRVHSQGLDHVGWNYDSQDSSTKIIKKARENNSWYIQKVLKDFCTNPQNSIMSLFHDRGKDFNAKTMDRIIKIGQCLGINFVTYQELLSEKEFLERVGVLQEAPRLEGVSSILKESFKALEPGQVRLKCESAQKEELSCKSQNGTEYFHCQGEDSVCLYGKWYRHDDPEVLRVCRKKRCFSEYQNRYFNHCEGISSICIDGKWLNKSDPKVQNQCQ